MFIKLTSFYKSFTLLVLVCILLVYMNVQLLHIDKLYYNKFLFLLLGISFTLYFLCIISIVHFLAFKEYTYYYYTLYLLISNFYLTLVFHLDYSSQKLFVFTVPISHFVDPIRIISYYFYTIFSLQFLNIKREHSKIYKLLKINQQIFLGLAIASLLLHLFLSEHILFPKLRDLLLLFCMPIGLLGIVTVFLKIKNPIAIILTVGSVFFFSGSVLTYLFSTKTLQFSFSIFPFNHLLFYNEAGTVLECIMFFGSFAYRNKLIAEKEVQQRGMVSNLRNDISKDLHDEIGSTITSIHILSSVSQQTLHTKYSDVHQMLKQIENQSKSIQQNMSDIIWSMRDENYCIDNLLVRIKEYVSQTLEPLKIETCIKMESELTNYNFDIRQRKELLLIIKEAINNIAKHADATQVKIHFLKQANNLEFIIEDNGCWKGGSTGSGTKNMNERIKTLGGTICFVSSNTGTQVICNCPLT